MGGLMTCKNRARLGLLVWTTGVERGRPSPSGLAEYQLVVIVAGLLIIGIAVWIGMTDVPNLHFFARGSP
jgi:hypothetical protein